jgi:TolB-like protein/tetratricopeptide (TPR) repeat protein
MSFFNELKSRNVIRVATAYVVASWLIIQVVETIFPLYGLSDGAIRTVISILAIAFFPALIFSWVFEITPQGLKREADLVRNRPTGWRPGGKLDRVIIVLLALALGYFVVDKFLFDEADSEEVSQTVAPVDAPTQPVVSPDENSIAVLPFLNLSPDPDQDYLSDGISEELLTLLAKIPELRVMSRTSSFSFKGQNLNAPAIAERLNVAHILEGSLRKSDNHVRVTAQLIDARTDTHLWSEVYERELSDIFTIQKDIAVQVADSLKHELLDRPGRPVVDEPPTGDMQAYQLYLRGNHHKAQRSREGLQLAADSFRRALELDPEYGPAWSGLAETLGLLSSYGYRPVGDIRQEAEQAIETALTLDPQSGAALAAKGLLLSQLDLPHDEVVMLYRKALELNPSNSQAHMWLAGKLAVTDPEAAEEHIRKAYELDPLSGIVVFNLAGWLLRSGHLPEARDYGEELLTLDPRWPAAHQLLAQIAMTQGDTWSWFRSMLKAVELDPDDLASLTALANGYVSIGDLDTATDYAMEAFERAPNSPNVVALHAYLLDMRGDHEGALQAVNDLLARYPDDKTALAAAIFMEAHVGRPSRALALCRRSWDADSPPAILDPDSLFSNVAPCVHALRASGLGEEADALAESGISVLGQLGTAVDIWQRYYAAARIAMAAGKPETAKAELEIALDKGLSPVGVFPLESWLEPYRDRPGFQTVFDRLDRDAADVFNRLTEEHLTSGQRSGH